MIKVNRQNLSSSHEAPWLVLDLVMMGLLLLNLVWIVFDSLYATNFFRQTLLGSWPEFVDAYRPIHHNFALYDLFFVGIFFSEFCLRWIVAIRRKEYLRWYFYPFSHWYDLIGCLPLSGARIFRFLRIFSILYRLHKYQIINLRDTVIFRFMAFYYDVFVEELSDRIVVKVLSDAQKDIEAGSPLIDDIMQNILAKRTPILTRWVASVMVHTGQNIEDASTGNAIKAHVRQSVGKAVRDNNQVSTLSLVPVLGISIERTLEYAVTDIVTQSIINLLKDITPEKLDNFIEEGLTDFSSDDHQLNQEALNVITECIELVKGHVSSQRWKQVLKDRDEALGRSDKPEGAT